VKVPLVESGSVMRARVCLQESFLGKSRAYLETEDGRKGVKALAYFFGDKPLSVVFTDDRDQLIYWIGPTEALPPNAKGQPVSPS